MIFNLPWVLEDDYFYWIMNNVAYARLEAAYSALMHVSDDNGVFFI
jgi:hypothetical protein